MKKSILTIFSVFGGVVIGATGIMRIMVKTLHEKQDMSDKHLSLFLMMNQWVKVKQEGKNLSVYFEENEYHNIAIYGMSYVGVTLTNELRDTNIKVMYGIDKQIKNGLSDVRTVLPDDDLEKVDAVVVTAITSFDKISRSLYSKLQCPIVSLEEVLGFCMQM